jgi:acetoin utilization deacetylase AcuC-like enzyme
MKFFYSDLFTFPLPSGHRFPIHKYNQLRERLVQSGLTSKNELVIPGPATDEQILLAHTEGYLNRVKNGSLSPEEIRRIGFPWSKKLVERSRRSVGGTIEASRAALVDGCSINLAGGTHHAGKDHGEGFCLFNDVAIAALVMVMETRVERVVIIDGDVHQGNGTAAILWDKPFAYSFSIHGEKNFPFRKIKGDLDISLPDGTEDQVFLESFQLGLLEALDRSQAGLAIYLAGADPFEGDRLGRLRVSKRGLDKRDRLVFNHCQQRHIPVVVTMAGGYATPIEDTVDIHFNTVKLAVEFFTPVQY